MILSFKQKWYNMLPPHLKPKSNKVKKLERLRNQLNLPHDIFFMGIGTTKWAVIKTQEATLKQLKKVKPNVSDKELWKEVIISRLKTKINMPSPFDISQDELIERIENIDDIIANINNFKEIIDYIIDLDKDNLFDPSGIQDEIDQILLENKIEEKEDKNRDLELLDAVKERNIEKVKLLIKKGANVNIKGEYVRKDKGFVGIIKKVTPLIVATLVDSVELVKLLIEKGSDVNARDSIGNTALTYAKGGNIIKNKKNVKIIIILKKNDAA